MEKSSEFDILRAVGTVAVVVIHTTSIFGTFNSTSMSYLIFGTINKICNFAVPLFLFLSVLLLVRKHINDEKFETLKFYKRRFLKTLPLYLFYVILYYFYLRFIGVELIPFSEKPIDFFANYILQGSIFYHLYFMPIIFQLYLLFPIIIKIAKAVKKISLPLLPNSFLSLSALVLMQYLFQLIHARYIWPHFQKPAIIIFTYLLPIGIGIWCALNYEKLKKSIPVGLAISVIAFISGYIFVHYSLFPTCSIHGLIFPLYTATASVVLLYISIFMSQKLEDFIKTFLLKISAYSFTIYLIHPLMLEIFMKFFKSISLTKYALIDNSIYIFASFVFTFGLSYLFASTTNYIKHLRQNR